MTLSFLPSVFLLFILLAQPVGFFSKLGVNKLISFLKIKLQDLLKTTFKKNLIKSLIKFGTTYLGIVVVVFNFFGKKVSMLIAAFLFLFNLVWTFISFMKIIPKIYKLPVYLIKTKSIYETLLLFLDDNWDNLFNDELINQQGIFTRSILKLLKKSDTKTLENAYDNYKKIGGKFSVLIKELPDLREITHSLLRYIVKFIKKYVIFFAIYFLILFILQPVILETFAGITKWQIILFPFLQIKNAFKYLFS